jgi:hypothetical protein
VLQKYFLRMANLFVAALIQTGIRRASDEKETQLRAVVRSILVRKAQSLGLHVFTFFRRISLDLLFHGLHTWRHFSLKKTLVEDQARLMNLLQCSQLEVAQYQTQVVDVKLLDRAEQENQCLVHNLRNLCHVHCCLIVVERALQRSLRDAFIQMQMHTKPIRFLYRQHFICLKSLLVSLIHDRLQWAWRQWDVMIEAKISAVALSGALDMYDIPFAGLAAMRQVASEDRATVLKSVATSHTLSTDATLHFDVADWVFSGHSQQTDTFGSRSSYRAAEAVNHRHTSYNEGRSSTVSSNSVVAAMRSLMLESLSDSETYDSTWGTAHEVPATNSKGFQSVSGVTEQQYRGQSQVRGLHRESESKSRHLRAVHVLSAVLHRVLARHWHETWMQLRSACKASRSIRIPVERLGGTVSSFASSGHWLASSAHSAHNSRTQHTQANEAVQRDDSHATIAGGSAMDTKMSRIEAGLARLANAVGPRVAASTPSKQMWSPATAWTPGPRPPAARSHT